MNRGTHRAGAGRFTAAEELACYFDTESEPCNIHLEVRVQGQLDEPALRAAAIAALTANRRTNSRRARPGALSLSYHWQPPGRLDADPVSAATYADAAQLTQLRNAFLATAPPIDLAPPARLLLASGPGGDYVILNAHHAVMDGLSCLELLRDIARRYRAAIGLPPRQSAAPMQARPGGTRPAGPRPTAVAEPVKPTRIPPPHRPARIAADSGGGRGCGLHLELLPAVPAVLEFRDGSRPTLNEALIAAVITAVGSWNSEHGRGACTVRVTIPVNTRQPGTPFVAGNKSRLVTVLARPLGGGAAMEQLLRTVMSQAQAASATTGPQIDRASRGLAGRWCPASLKRRLVRVALRTVGPFVVDTVMLTNLGNITEPPDFGVADIATMAFSGPAQMPRGLSVAVVTAGGQPQIGVRYNRALMDAAAAARFTSLMLHALHECTVTRDPALINPL